MLSPGVLPHARPLITARPRTTEIERAPCRMIYLLVSDDSLFHRMVSETFLQDEEVCQLGRPQEERRGLGRARPPFYGDLAEPETFRRVGARPAVGRAGLHEGRRADARRPWTPCPRSRPEVKVLVTTTNGELDHLVRGQPAQGVLGGHGGGPAGDGVRAAAHAGARAGGARPCWIPPRTSPCCSSPTPTPTASPARWPCARCCGATAPPRPSSPSAASRGPRTSPCCSSWRSTWR